MKPQPIPILSRPGIKRDGTRFSGDYYVDGQWTRFERGLPRKIGGFRRLTSDATGLIRQFHTQARDQFVYVHSGCSDCIERFTIDNAGNASPAVDRTPSGFVASDLNNWQIDAMFDGGSSAMAIIGHAAPNNTHLADDTSRPVYIGDLYGTSPLTPISGSDCSGGIVVLHPYLFRYGSDGLLAWSPAGMPDQTTGGDSNEARVTSSKIVKGLPLRGGGNSPSGLFWSLDTLIRVSYVGGDSVFAADAISSSISIMSANSAIEFDGVYYWIGLDRFLLFNGVVREVENQLNIDWFFRELNWLYAPKVFAFKVPRFGEIWWCFPRGTSTEPNHAIIYNVREQTWYDTALPGGGRSAGIYAQVFRSPLMAGVDMVEKAAPPATRVTEAGDRRITESGDVRVTDNGADSYRVWRHEFGTDEIDGSQVRAIEAYIETHEMSLLKQEQPASNAYSITLVEPDFVQSGNMRVQVRGRINARAPTIESDAKIYPDVATSGDEENVYLKDTHRIVSFRFSSNDVGGDFQMGQVVAHVASADMRTQT